MPNYGHTLVVHYNMNGFVSGLTILNLFTAPSGLSTAPSAGGGFSFGVQKPVSTGTPGMSKSILVDEYTESETCRQVSAFACSDKHSILI